MQIHNDKNVSLTKRVQRAVKKQPGCKSAINMSCDIRNVCKKSDVYIIHSIT